MFQAYVGKFFDFERNNCIKMHSKTTDIQAGSLGHFCQENKLGSTEVQSLIYFFPPEGIRLTSSDI